MAAIRVCQSISNLYRNVYLFRYDSRKKIIYVLAGRSEDEAEQLPVIEIYADGYWEFVEDE